MERPQFENGEIYHVYNRGVEKRKIFLDDKDYLRFIHDLFEFNDTSPAGKFFIFGGGTSEYAGKKKRELLVEILAFCLMPNHYHLLLKQLQNGGITKFMKKLDTGYTMYFNKIKKRVGPLFQGVFKAVSIDKQAQFYHIPYYIHLNPVELAASNWKEEGIKSPQKVEEFLKTYRWSSHLDYIGKKNFPSILSTKFLSKIWGGPQKYKLDFNKLLKDFNRFNVYNEENLD
jgi:putative transposase